MRLVLEKKDLLKIVGKHFDITVDEEKFLLRTDPFELEITGIPLPGAEEDPQEDRKVVAMPQRVPGHRPPPPPPQDPAERRADAGVMDDAPEPGFDGMTPVDSPELHPAAILEQSRRLQEELDRENPQLAQRTDRILRTTPGSDFSRET